MPPSIAPQHITGLVLAGGRGSRMGGLDKGLQRYRGRPLVAHALSVLERSVATILISANREDRAYREFGHPIVHDLLDEHEGPLAGIAAALAICGTDYLIAVPCDAPHMPDDLVPRLSTAFATPSDRVAIAATAERVHPIFCMMRRDVAASLDAFLANGGRSVRRWAESLAGATVPFEDERAFRNLNTLDDLHDAERSS